MFRASGLYTKITYFLAFGRPTSSHLGDASSQPWDTTSDPVDPFPPQSQRKRRAVWRAVAMLFASTIRPGVGACSGSGLDRHGSPSEFLQRALDLLCVTTDYDGHFVWADTTAGGLMGLFERHTANTISIILIVVVR